MDNIQTYTKLSGAVSLYLSISFSLLLTLIFHTIEAAHLDSLLCRADSISYICSDSLFARYCLPLFEKYGIFAVNEQGMDISSVLTSYAEKNSCVPSGILKNYESFLYLSVDGANVTNIHYITDDDAADFITQVNECIKYLELDYMADQLVDYCSTDSPDVFSQTDEGVADITFGTIDSSAISEYFSSDIDTDGKTDEDLTGIDNDTFLESISTSIGHFIKNSLLSCILEDPSSISDATIDKVFLPSVTCDLSEDGHKKALGYHEDYSDATFEKACFCEYITHIFGCYRDIDDDSALKYQMEYIIAGTDSDDTNLINTALQLISLRTGLNLVHLFSDKSKFNAAWSIASKASAIPLAPYIIQISILTVWATAEAIIDIRDLLSGKSVPLIKNSEQWTLSLQGLKSFSKSIVSANDGTSGLNYERYLEMLIAVQNNVTVCYRTLDLMQMDICKQYNTNFRISKCFTSMEADFIYTLPYLIKSGSNKYTHHIKFNYR